MGMGGLISLSLTLAFFGLSSDDTDALFGRPESSGGDQRDVCARYAAGQLPLEKAIKVLELKDKTSPQQLNKYCDFYKK